MLLGKGPLRLRSHCMQRLGRSRPLTPPPAGLPAQRAGAAAASAADAVLCPGDRATLLQQPDRVVAAAIRNPYQLTATLPSRASLFGGIAFLLGSAGASCRPSLLPPCCACCRFTGPALPPVHRSCPGGWRPAGVPGARPEGLGALCRVRPDPAPAVRGQEEGGGGGPAPSWIGQRSGPGDCSRAGRSCVSPPVQRAIRGMPLPAARFPPARLPVALCWPSMGASSYLPVYHTAPRLRSGPLAFARAVCPRRRPFVGRSKPCFSPAAAVGRG